MSNTTEWRMVPLHPTQEMRDALRAGSRRDVPSDQLCDVRYAAMLANAPQPPAAEQMTDEQAREVLDAADDVGNTVVWMDGFASVRGWFTATELRAILHFAPKA